MTTGAGAARTSVTALVLRALHASDPSLDLSSSVGWLSAKQSSDGGFGDSPSTVHDTASALLTLGAQDRPTVVLLEDWHWVDAASRQVLRQLLEMISAYPLAIVVTARPEADLDWRAPAGHMPGVLFARQRCADPRLHDHSFVFLHLAPGHVY